MTEALAKVIPMEVIDFDITEEALVSLAEKHQGYEITNYKSYNVVVEAIAEVRGYRGQVEAHRKTLKHDALEYGKKVDGTARKITQRLWQIENPLKKLKTVVDDEKEAAKAENDRLEKVRVAEIQVKITSINNMVTGIGSLDAPSLVSLYTEIESLEITKEEYQEFTAHAQQVRSDALEAIGNARTERAKLDQEAAERKAEGEKLAKLKKEQVEEARRFMKAKIKAEQEAAEALAKLKAEQERLDVERREIEEEKAKIEAGKKAEQKRKDLEEREKKEAAGAKIQEEKDAKEKGEREEAEAKRQEALKPDKQLLLEMADMLEALILPNIKDKEAEVIRFQTRKGLNRLTEDVRRGVDQL